MASIAAEKVLESVHEEVRKGKIPNLQLIQQKHGYSPSSAKAMKATRTVTYKKGYKTLVEKLEAERDAILERLPHVRDKAKYRDLTDGLDKVTKTHQLLTGGATENIAVKPLATLEELRGDNAETNG